MEKLTRGPLEVSKGSHALGDTFGVKDSTGAWVAKCHPFDGQAGGVEEALAYATLFAAAPELGALLKELYEAGTVFHGDRGERLMMMATPNQVKAIQDALRKAGVSP